MSIVTNTMGSGAMVARLRTNSIYYVQNINVKKHRYIDTREEEEENL
jgi:hypothetical protein